MRCLKRFPMSIIIKCTRDMCLALALSKQKLVV